MIKFLLGYSLDFGSYYNVGCVAMEDYPETIIEFEKRFSTEDDCRKYLFNLR